MRALVLVWIVCLIAGCGGVDSTDEAIGSSETQPSNSVLVLLHEIRQYCERDDDGNLLVAYQNIGDIAYQGGAELTVSFITSAGEVDTQQTLGAIGINSVRNVPFTIPAGCFNPDCDFSITRSNQPSVGGRCIG